MDSYKKYESFNFLYGNYTYAPGNKSITFNNIRNDYKRATLNLTVVLLSINNPDQTINIYTSYKLIFNNQEFHFIGNTSEALNINLPLNNGNVYNLELWKNDGNLWSNITNESGVPENLNKFGVLMSFNFYY